MSHLLIVVAAVASPSVLAFAFAFPLAFAFEVAADVAPLVAFVGSSLVLRLHMPAINGHVVMCVRHLVSAK